MTLAAVSPANAPQPVGISFSTHPNANRSVRASVSFRSRCSGATWGTVPAHPARADGGLDLVRPDLSTLLEVALSLSKGEARAG